MVSVKHYVHLEERSLYHLRVDNLVLTDHFYRIHFPRARKLSHVNPAETPAAKLSFENEVLEGDLTCRDR